VLATGLRADNPKRRNASLATAMVLLIAVLDIAATVGVRSNHSRGSSGSRDYRDRSAAFRVASSSPAD
jgi:hypothetical protein